MSSQPYVNKCLTLIVAGLLLSLSNASATQSDNGSIRGTITDVATRRPVEGAVVRVVGLELQATTDARGVFLLNDVPVGTHVLRVARIGYAPVSRSDVLVTPGRTTEVPIAIGVASQLETLEVIASEFAAPPEITTSSVTLNYDEIRRSPGALGDVSRLIQSLPGVVNGNDQRNDIIARGGSPLENLTIVDNIEVPNLNHFAAQATSGGPISMLNNEFVNDATFLAGGFPAEYGNRLSSVLDIRLREGNRQRVEAEFDANMAGAGFIVEGPLAIDRGSWLVSVRQSFLALLAEPFGITAVPYTTNYQAKFTFDIDERNKLWFIGIGGRDNILFEVDPTDLEDPSTEEIDARGWRAVNGINWQHLIGDRGFGILSVSDAFSSFDTDVRDGELGFATTFRNRSREGETTAKYDFTLAPEGAGYIKAGVAGKFFRTRTKLDQPLGAQNPFSANATRVNPIALDRRDSEFLGSAYLQFSRPIGRHVDLTAGTRLDHFGYGNDTRVGPRAGFSIHLTPTLDLNGSYGRYYQQPPLVYVAADPVNADLSPIRADHFIGGLSFIPRSDLKVTVEAYWKSYDDYPVSLEYPTFSLANSGDVFGPNGLLFPMSSEGTGRSRGVELFVQKKLTRSLYGQISYTFSRAEHAALDGVLRRGAFDIPHTATLISGYKFGNGLELSSRFSYASGRPTTPPLPESSVQNRYILDLGQLNVNRAPAYHRLDLRADWRFSIGPLYATMNLAIQNIYNRDNVFLMVWNRKTRQLDTESQIGFLPIFGMNVEF